VGHPPIGALGAGLSIDAISVINSLRVLAFVSSAILTGVGLSYEIDVIRASRAQAQQLAEERTRVKEETEKSKPTKSKLLFHYTDQFSAELILAEGRLDGASEGTYGFGNYATDIAGWLAESIMRRSQLTTIIFGRNTPANYAKTTWFVAFEQAPEAPFRKAG
jgi:hypothetical protein